MFKATALNNDQIKINTSCRDEIAGITQSLANLNLPWHSYENKQIRNVKVTVRGLPPTTRTEKVVTELNQSDLKSYLEWRKSDARKTATSVHAFIQM